MTSPLLGTDFWDGSSTGGPGALAPLARLVDLSQDTPAGRGPLATTQNLVDFSAGWELDKAGSYGLTVGLADAGDAATPSAPTAAAVTQSSSLNAGAHKWLVTFVINGVETGAGTASNTLTTSSGQVGSLSSIPTGPAGTTARWVYRNTLATPSTYYRLTSSTTPSLNNNTTTTYTDNASDASISGNAQPPTRTSFSTALLAAGGTDTGTAPVPTLVELSLDGGDSWDVRGPVEKPTRQLRVTEPVITVQGDDAWIVYSSMVAIDRATFTDCKLSDILSAAGGTIIPVHGSQYPFIGTTIPNLAGIVTATPGATSWPASAGARLKYSAVTDSTVSSIATDVDIWADYVSKAVATICRRLGGVIITSDSVAQGSRGHYVADSSDILLNLSRRVSGATATARSVVVGSVGTTPGGVSTFTFDGTAATRVTDETTTARLDVDQCSIEPDLTTLYGQASFIGGASNAGFPANGTITGLTVLNDVWTSPYGNPYMSTNKDSWQDNLCVMSISAGDASGLYYYFGDGMLHPWPNYVAADHLCLAVDKSTTPATLYVGTPHGVYYRNSDPTDTTTVWKKVGSLSGRVVRLGISSHSGNPVIFAQVKATSQDGKNGLDGIFRTTYSSGTYGATSGSVSGAGWDGWTPIVQAETIIDYVVTDWQTAWVLLKADQTAVWQFVASGTGAPVKWALPSGITAYKIHRVVTAGDGGAHSSQDSVWVSTTGSETGPSYAGIPQPLYYSLNTSGTWSAFTAGAGNQDGSLTSASNTVALTSGQAVTVNRAVGLGLTINGVWTAAFVCTSNGIFYSSHPFSATPAWTSCNGMSGLDGIPITNIAAGQSQTVIPPAGSPGSGLALNRIFACNENRFFYSNSAALFWTDLFREKLSAGPYFSWLAQQVHSPARPSDFPSNVVQTIGPMSSPPLGGASNTHIQITHAPYPSGAAPLPTGWYWHRRLDDRQNFVYRLVNPNCPLPSLMYSQLSDIETNEVVPVITASSNLALVMIRWLAENSTAQTILHLPSSFTQVNSGLRVLRPTMAVKVNLTGSIAARSSTGAILSSNYVNYSNQTFYVLSHHIQKAREGGPLCETSTVVGSILRSNVLSPEDYAAAMADDVKALKTFGAKSVA